MTDTTPREGAELPPLPTPLIHREDFPAFQTKIAMDCYSAPQMDAFFRAGFEAGRATRPVAEAERIDVTEAARVLFEEIGTYSVQCAKTGEMAPSKSLLDAADVLIALARLSAPAESLAAPEAPDVVAHINALTESAKREARHLFELSDKAEDMVHLSMAIDRLSAFAIALSKRAAVAAAAPSAVPVLTDEQIKLAAEKAELVWEQSGALYASKRDDCDTTPEVLAFARSILALATIPAPSAATGEVAQEIEQLAQEAMRVAREYGLMRATDEAGEGSRGMNGRAWTEYEREVLRLHYARTLTSDLADLLGHTLSSTHQQARKLGLAKSREWIAETARLRIEADPNHGSRRSRIQPGNVPANKGLKHPPGWAPGRMAESQFKKGRRAEESRNYLPIGSTRVTRDGILERKVTDDPSIYPARRWINVSRLVWEAEYGPIPADHLVRFKDGQRTVIEAEITVDRLECLDRAEHARRNQAPVEIRRIHQLRGAITRQINRRLKEASE